MRAGRYPGGIKSGIYSGEVERGGASEREVADLWRDGRAEEARKAAEKIKKREMRRQRWGGKKRTSQDISRGVTGNGHEM